MTNKFSGKSFKERIINFLIYECEKTAGYIYLFSGGLTVLLLHFLLLPEQQRQIEKMIDSVNTAVFMISLFFFCFLCLILHLGLRLLLNHSMYKVGDRVDTYTNQNTLISKGKISVFFFWLVRILFFLLLYKCFLVIIYNETSILGSPAADYLWHTQTLFSGIILTAAAFSFCAGLLRTSSLDNHKTIEKRICVLCAQAGILYVYARSLFFTNYLFDGAVAHHANAYYNSVYNVLHGAAYTDISNTIYGNYALFLAPILKLIGPSMLKFGILMTAVGIVYMLCMAYAINTLVKRTSLQILGFLAAGASVIGFRTDIYYQAQPHRVIFPGILLAYTVFTYQKGKNRFLFQVGGFILTTLSILWNKEVGIICSISWTAVQIYWKLHQNARKQYTNEPDQENKSSRNARLKRNQGRKPRFFFSISISFLGFPAAVFLATIIVGLYNFAVSGIWITMDAFWFPLFQKEYVVDTLQIPLANRMNLDIVIYLVFLAAIARAIFLLVQSKWLGKADGSEKAVHDADQNSTSSGGDSILLFTSLLGVGLLQYYVNRPAYFNLDITYGFFFLLVCIYIEKAISKRKNDLGKDRIFGAFRDVCIYAGVFLLVAASVMSIWHFPENDTRRSVFRTAGHFGEFSLRIQEQIPPNTIAFGNGIAEIYTALGWDSGLYILDASDLNVSPSAREYLITYISHLDEPILIAENRRAPMLDDHNFSDVLSSFKIEKKLRYGDISYLYFVPIPE